MQSMPFVQTQSAASSQGVCVLSIRPFSPLRAWSTRSCAYRQHLCPRRVRDWCPFAIAPASRRSCCCVSSCAANTSNRSTLSRRQILRRAVTLLNAGCLGLAMPAQADVLRDLVKGYVRPEVAADQAIVQLMDARGTLMELKALAATAPNSQERFEARRMLPGMATQLRKVSSAAPVAAALASGTASEATLSYLYGGSATEGVSELSMAIPVYEAIGRVITISGRTIRKEAQASPTNAEAAITAIEKLLAACPEQDLVRAQDMRKARVNMKAV